MQISAREIENYKGKLCPNCRRGIMKEKLAHDPIGGNYSILCCSRKNYCGFQISIVLEKAETG